MGAQVISEDVIQVERSVAKVNPKFDTIYLASDVGSPSRAYRIVERSTLPIRRTRRRSSGSSLVARMPLPTFIPSSGAAPRHGAFRRASPRPSSPLGEDLGINSPTLGWIILMGCCSVSGAGDCGRP